MVSYKEEHRRAVEAVRRELDKLDRLQVEYREASRFSYPSSDKVIQQQTNAIRALAGYVRLLDLDRR